jgi:hypothetical protein
LIGLIIKLKMILQSLFEAMHEQLLGG